ncbi:hypothetical protein EK21DRAFT_89621 [Setomelanomma holmii]|uniref:Uncharacterized protein n=1 Tax=Setomelanomma holmii TaxID=210430 RepID=A0A9P4LMH4_9PLEO|nr:hypothetical protein EK21DRAFT_89621 [Setomelanomma holmii]
MIAPLFTELYERHESFANDLEVPADLRARGVDIFHAAINANVPAALQQNERVTLVLNRTMIAIGELYSEHERRTRSNATFEAADSSRDGESAQLRETTDSPGSSSFATSGANVISNCAEYDEEGHNNERSKIQDAIATREKRSVATHGPRAPMSAAAGVVKVLKRNRTSSTMVLPTDTASLNMIPTSTSKTTRSFTSTTDKHHHKDQTSSSPPYRLVVKLKMPKLPDPVAMDKDAFSTRLTQKKEQELSEKVSLDEVARHKQDILQEASSRKRKRVAGSRACRNKAIPKSTEILASDSEHDGETGRPTARVDTPKSQKKTRRKRRAPKSAEFITSELEDDDDGKKINTKHAYPRGFESATESIWMAHNNGSDAEQSSDMTKEDDSVSNNELRGFTPTIGRTAQPELSEKSAYLPSEEPARPAHDLKGHHRAILHARPPSVHKPSSAHTKSTTPPPSRHPLAPSPSPRCPQSHSSSLSPPPSKLSTPNESKTSSAPLTIRSPDRTCTQTGLTTTQTFPSLPNLPTHKRAPFYRSATIALSNIL